MGALGSWGSKLLGEQPNEAMQALRTLLGVVRGSGCVLPRAPRPGLLGRGKPLAGGAPGGCWAAELPLLPRGESPQCLLVSIRPFTSRCFGSKGCFCQNPAGVRPLYSPCRDLARDVLCAITGEVAGLSESWGKTCRSFPGITQLPRTGAGLSPAPGLCFFVLNTLAVLAGGVQPVLGGDVARVRAGSACVCCAMRGLGLALSEEQSPRKNRASPSFQASKKLVAATGQQCLPLAVDVRQPQTIVAAVDEALREFKRIDILVNGELPGLGRGRLAQSVLGRAFCTWAASAASALRCCALGAARQ